MASWMDAQQLSRRPQQALRLRTRGKTSGQALQSVVTLVDGSAPGSVAQREEAAPNGPKVRVVDAAAFGMPARLAQQAPAVEAKHGTQVVPWFELVARLDREARRDLLGRESDAPLREVLAV